MGLFFLRAAWGGGVSALMMFSFFFNEFLRNLGGKKREKKGPRDGGDGGQIWQNLCEKKIESTSVFFSSFSRPETMSYSVEIRETGMDH